MKHFQETRDIGMLARGAIAANIGGAQELDSPCNVLQRLAQMIQRMRLEPADAHVYREVCETLVQRATAASKWSHLPQALAQIMRLVEQHDYHWALVELRTITQPEWHAC